MSYLSSHVLDFSYPCKLFRAQNYKSFIVFYNLNMNIWKKAEHNVLVHAIPVQCFENCNIFSVCYLLLSQTQNDVLSYNLLLTYATKILTINSTQETLFSDYFLRKLGVLTFKSQCNFLCQLLECHSIQTF